MNRPEVTIIAALAEQNRAIGYRGKLPWSIPEDLRHFRELTLGHAVLLGRKTWALDLQKRALRQRRNIVLTSQPQQYSPDLEANAPLEPGTELIFANSLSMAIALVAPYTRLFIAGGASVYAQALPLADRLELTLVEGTFEADTFFPDYHQHLHREFIRTKTECHPGYRFETYQRQTVG